MKKNKVFKQLGIGLISILLVCPIFLSSYTSAYAKDNNNTWSIGGTIKGKRTPSNVKNQVRNLILKGLKEHQQNNSKHNFKSQLNSTRIQKIPWKDINQPQLLYKFIIQNDKYSDNRNIFNYISNSVDNNREDMNQEMIASRDTNDIKHPVVEQQYALHPGKVYKLIWIYSYLTSISKNPNYYHSYKNIKNTLALYDKLAKKKGKVRIHKSEIKNPIKSLSWKQVNNTNWIYNALHKKNIYNYLKYNDRNKEDRIQIKQAYQDAKKDKVREARKVYKMMWIKDYDFLHHGETFSNTVNAMTIFDNKGLTAPKPSKKLVRFIKYLEKGTNGSPTFRKTVDGFKGIASPQLRTLIKQQYSGSLNDNSRFNHNLNYIAHRESYATKVLNRLLHSKNRIIKNEIKNGVDDGNNGNINIKYYHQYYYRVGILLSKIQLTDIGKTKVNSYQWRLMTNSQKRELLKDIKSWDKLRPGRILKNNYNSAYHYALKHPKANFAPVKETEAGENQKQYADIAIKGNKVIMQDALQKVPSKDRPIMQKLLALRMKGSTKLGLNIIR